VLNISEREKVCFEMRAVRDDFLQLETKLLTGSERILESWPGVKISK